MPEKSDWELLVLADVPEKASACVLKEEGPIEEGPIEEAPMEEGPMEEAPIEEAPAEYESSPEGELPTAKAHPVEERDKDPPANAKPTEGI
ncbi:ATP-binding cassette sub-family A member 2 [Fusarium austroafricanum]|uniref:ATP-binding cassette sub-family A member 2 n=1 Tax=Fusarium austroafricanum TaxID=2364996 RepID=A0A8H4NJK0_9HYPO|nr:ATP-binding cassette sub-family A member 2 [Fusarium austroafricanum]